jgi:hypothetical protein
MKFDIAGFCEESICRGKFRFDFNVTRRTGALREDVAEFFSE